MTVRPLQYEDLYLIPFVSDVQVAPDATRIAFVVTQADEEQDKNQSRVWLVDVDGAGSARPITEGPSDSAPRWSPDGNTLAFLAAGRADDKKPVLRLLPMAGGEARVLVGDGQAGTPVWSPDGRSIAFSAAVDLDEGEPDHAPVVVTRLGYKTDGAGLVKGRRSHLFVVDVESGEVRQLTEGDHSMGGPAWSPDGSTIVVSGAVHDDRDINPSAQLWAVRADGNGAGEPVALTPQGGLAGTPVFTPDGTKVLYVGRVTADTGHARLLTVPAGGGQPPTEVAPSFDRNVLVGAPAYPGAPPRLLDDGTVLFCARDRGCTHVYRVPVAGGEPQKIVGGGDRSVGAMSASRDGSLVAVVIADQSGPGEVYVTGATGERRVTDLTAAALAGIEWGRWQERTFEIADGTEVHGWLLNGSKEGGPKPLLLDIHGGPHNAWNPVFDAVHTGHHVLADDGWAVLILNPRASDGYGEDFYRASIGQWGRGDIDDFLTPLDVLVAEGIADPDRIGVTGYSYGGYMTCWLTTQAPERFAAAIAGGCVSNLASEFGTADMGHALSTLEIGGTPQTDPERFADLSPITHVARVRTPTLLLHGENDDRCPIEQAEQWFAALRAAEVPTEMVRYPGGSHLFIVLGRPSHRIDYNRRIVEWLGAWTKR